jgi:hypothetical protein
MAKQYAAVDLFLSHLLIAGTMLPDTRVDFSGFDKTPIHEITTNFADFAVFWLGHHATTARRDTRCTAQGMTETATIMIRHAAKDYVLKVTTGIATNAATVKRTIFASSHDVR